MLRIIATGKSGSIGKFLPTASPIFSRAESTEFQTLTELISLKSKVLIHLAGISNPNEILENESRAIDVNLEWPLRLMDQFVASGGQTFIFVSTSHVYGTRPHGMACYESSLLSPMSRYGELKAEAEISLASRANYLGINFMTVRVFSVFGPGMADHYLASRVQRVLDGIESPSLIQNSADIRDFSAPIDVAKHLEALARICNRGNSPGVLNLGSGLGVSVKERILQADPFWPVDLFNNQTSDVPYLVADIQGLDQLYAAQGGEFE